MISYYTHIQVKENFNEEVLISLFLDWLNNSKNKIDNLNYEYQSSFEYVEERKQLKIEDFNEYQVFGIQFTTSDNYKKAQFVVEILYNYSNQTLDLGFYKELNEDSKYISAISLPKIFVTLLKSEYIKQDRDLIIQDEPIFLNYKQFKYLPKHHDYPLVVLNKNKKCIVNPFKLAQKLFGLAHVICIRNNDDLSMKIYYPNDDIEKIEEDNEIKMIKECYDQVLDYSIQEHTQNYMFDELIKARLHEETKSSEEFENMVQTECNKLKKEVIELEKEHKEKYEEYLRLKKLIDEIHNDNQNKQIELLIMKENNEAKKELLKDLIERRMRALNTTNKNKIYREKDIYESIMKEN